MVVLTVNPEAGMPTEEAVGQRMNTATRAQRIMVVKLMHGLGQTHEKNQPRKVKNPQ